MCSLRWLQRLCAVSVLLCWASTVSPHASPSASLLEPSSLVEEENGATPHFQRLPSKFKVLKPTKPLWLSEHHLQHDEFIIEIPTCKAHAPRNASSPNDVCAQQVEVGVCDTQILKHQRKPPLWAIQERCQTGAEILMNLYCGPPQFESLLKKGVLCHRKCHCHVSLPSFDECNNLFRSCMQDMPSREPNGVPSERWRRCAGAHRLCFSECNYVFKNCVQEHALWSDERLALCLEDHGTCVERIAAVVAPSTDVKGAASVNISKSQLRAWQDELDEDFAFPLKKARAHKTASKSKKRPTSAKTTKTFTKTNSKKNPQPSPQQRKRKSAVSTNAKKTSKKARQTASGGSHKAKPERRALYHRDPSSAVVSAGPFYDPNPHQYRGKLAAPSPPPDLRPTKRKSKSKRRRRSSKLQSSDEPAYSWELDSEI